MNRTKIEWCDLSWNPVKGMCPMGCSYCYARKLYKRFRWDPTIRLDEEELEAPVRFKKPAKVFVGSTIELFGRWVKRSWLQRIFEVVEECPQHTFLFLTKLPKRASLWSPFPSNCWVGMSIPKVIHTPSSDTFLDLYWLKFRTLASVKFISFEPLLGDCSEVSLRGLDWIIIGAQTNPYRATKLGWIEGILSQAEKEEIPVFMKDNLKRAWPWGYLIQEWPR